MRFLTRIFLYFIWAYVGFLTLYKCRQDCSESGSLTQTYCAQVRSVVYPKWDQVVYPHLVKIDSQYGLSQTFQPHFEAVSLYWVKFDEKFRFSYKWDLLRARSSLWLSTTGADYQSRLKTCAGFWAARLLLYYDSKRPMISYYMETCKSTVSHMGHKVWAHVRINTKLFYRSSVKHIRRSIQLHVSPLVNQAIEWIRAHEYTHRFLAIPQIQWLITETRMLVSVLAVKSALLSDTVQQKTDFLRDEMYNLVSGDKSGINTKEITSEQDDFAQIEDSPIDSMDSDLSDSEIEYHTITHVLTKTIVQDDASAAEQETATGLTNEILIQGNTENEAVVEYGSDSSAMQIEMELEYWRSKVQKMTDMSYDSLESEMRPFLQATIADLKARISANFTEVQRDNYLRYKAMAELIALIDKDSEVIRTTGETIELPEVDRQMMRDEISGSREAVERAMQHVENSLNDAHGPVVEQYFAIAQNTIDVLESFADTTISEFSTRLSGLLSILEGSADFHDEMGWKAWKEFHKIKEQVFLIRDKILDGANLYKQLPVMSNRPHGLEEWAEYLNNVKFHIRFLLSDNDDYLKLVRAKANVAYQLREGLSREVLKRKAAQEAEAIELEAQKMKEMETDTVSLEAGNGQDEKDEPNEFEVAESVIENEKVQSDQMGVEPKEAKTIEESFAPDAEIVETFSTEADTDVVLRSVVEDANDSIPEATTNPHLEEEETVGSNDTLKDSLKGKFEGIVEKAMEIAAEESYEESEPIEADEYMEANEKDEA